MLGFSKFRQLEKRRYNVRAQCNREVRSRDQSQPPWISRPVERIHQLVASKARGLDSSEVCLEIFCGEQPILSQFGKFHAILSDFAVGALLNSRAYTNGANSYFVSADSESLPLRDCSVSMVVSAGGLSYVRKSILFREVERVLKPGGCFLIVDTLALNPIFFLNRLWHAFRGRRSLFTVTNMTSLREVKSLITGTSFRLEVFEVFGVLMFLAPFLEKICSPLVVNRVIHCFDEIPIMRPMGFKFVLLLEKKSKIRNE